MTTQPAPLDLLLERINGGHAAEVLPDLDLLHTQQPGNLAVMTLRAEALRHAGRHAEAIDAYRKAGESGGGTRNWLAAGILLASERATEPSMQCLRRALAQEPDSQEILDAAITTLFNGGRHQEGLEYARRQLTVSRNPTLLSRAALLLQANDLYDESAAAFKKIVELAPDDPAVIGAALVPARFTCEWEWIESLQRRISCCYEQGDFAAPQEFPLTHLTWCGDEARNLGVTRAYVARMVPRVPPVTPVPLPPAGRRIRVGYLSCDFRNHATMHLMAGLLEHHDRERFEIFAYDYSRPESSDYRQRFLESVEHLVPVDSMSDPQAAQRIAADRLDILFDLKLYTGNGRSGIMAYRPAALQATYLGFPGSAASPDIDYVVADRFVTPEGSAPFFTEKFCRLPHSYQCNDRKRAAAADPGTRDRHGLPQDAIVFGAFNQSYKIDRGSFTVWMRILRAVPNSVLWLLGQSEVARGNLSRHARLSGIDPARIIYAPFADPREHLARLQLADAVLDALICNGHTTTSDALWAGVPVITARGRHFASRVSESLLNAMELPELVGSDADDMVRIALRVGTDAAYRAALRAKVSANRLVAPLFDTARFTRDFEQGIELMVRRHQAGAPLDHVDVPDQGAVPAGAGKPATPLGRVSSLQVGYAGCPLCAGRSASLGFANVGKHALWHEPLPLAIEWMRCPGCAHIHTRHHWSAAGREELLRNAAADRAVPAAQQAAARGAAWISVIDRVTALLGGQSVTLRQPQPIWVDVGCGDGALLMLAIDHGFAGVGLDTHAATAERVRKLGFSALANDFLTLDFQLAPDVLSLFNVLPQLADPRAGLRKAAAVLRPGAVLVVSAPDSTSSTWRMLEASETNDNWLDPEQHHIFGRRQLVALLEECGFDIAAITFSPHALSHVEIYAVRRTVKHPT